MQMVIHSNFTLIHQRCLAFHNLKKFSFKIRMKYTPTVYKELSLHFWRLTLIYRLVFAAASILNMHLINR
jgi:hypothetical protein